MVWILKGQTCAQRQEDHQDELLCDQTVRESLCFQSPVRTRTRTRARARAEAGSCSSHLLEEPTKESDDCDPIVVMLVCLGDPSFVSRSSGLLPLPWRCLQS